MLQVLAVTVISGNGHLNEDGTVSSFGYGIRCNAPRLRVLAAYIGLSSDGSTKVSNMVPMFRILVAVMFPVLVAMYLIMLHSF